MKREKELLRKQLELLAEQSKGATEEEITGLSAAMCKVYETLHCPIRGTGFVIFAVSLANLFVSILIHVQNIFG